MALLEKYLELKEETRKVEDIAPETLNEYLSEFIITVRKENGEEYEPNSLRSFMASFERYLKKMKLLTKSIAKHLLWIIRVQVQNTNMNSKRYRVFSGAVIHDG